MASIGESLEIIGVLLDNDGYYPGDPQAFALSSYLNNWGGRTFHVAMNQSDMISLLNSPYCREVIKLWGRTSGLTIEGQEVLNKYKKEKK